MDAMCERTLLLHLLRQLQGIEATLLSKRGSFRSKSLTEHEQRYHSQGHGTMFCVHERSYFTPCKNCKRTQSDANKRRNAFFDKLGL